jgi:hypothetical protein
MLRVGNPKPRDHFDLSGLVFLGVFEERGLLDVESPDGRVEAGVGYRIGGAPEVGSNLHLERPSALFEPDAQLFLDF